MRTGYSQTNLLIRLETVLGKDELLLYEFLGEEFISDTFVFNLKLRSSNMSIETEKLLGTDASITIFDDGQTKKEFHGIISYINQMGLDTEFSYYEIKVIPRLSLLKYTENRRIFQNLNAVEIIVGLLNANKVEFETRLTNTYEKREYCVQYDESDFDFISRLLEDEGIFYFFTFKNGNHTFVLGDSIECHELCDQKQLFYRSNQSDRVGSDTVTKFESITEIAPKSVSLRGYDYLNAGVLASESYSSEKDFGEIYKYFGGFVDGILSEGKSKKEMEQLRLESQVNRGESLCFSLQAGSFFSLQEYRNEDVNQDYIIKSITHSFKNEKYGNSFEAIPIDHPVRPIKKTRIPRVAGTHSAFVVGPPGEEIWTDSLGRIKVKFHWDRSDINNENSSCWLRVSQTWADTGWGHLFIPRIGQEVLVTYVDGNPDKPVVTGCVYNSERDRPVDLPSNQTQSVIRSKPFTKSTREDTADNFVTDLSNLKNTAQDFSNDPFGFVNSIVSENNDGRGIGNEIRFEDKMNEEEFYLHAHKDMKIEIENNLTTTIFKGDEIHKVEKGNRTVKVLEGSEDHLVEKDRVVTINGDEIKNNSQNFTQNIDGNFECNVKGDYTLNIEGDLSIKVKGKVLLEAEDSISILTKKEFLQESEKTFKINSEDKCEIKAAQSLKIEALSLELQASTTSKLKGGTSVEINGGANVSVSSPQIGLG